MGEMCSLCEYGDVKLIWDPELEEECILAEKAFKDLIENKNHLAFGITKKGKQGKKRIYKFDKNLSRILLVPPIMGG